MIKQFLIKSTTSVAARNTVTQSVRGGPLSRLIDEPRSGILIDSATLASVTDGTVLIYSR
jgi:hypothetical protein